jgi:hypothetical protein
MWEFTVHGFSRSVRWTWVRVGSSGRAVAKSKLAFSTWTDAFSDAVANGLDSAKDQYNLIDLRGKQLRRAQGLAEAMSV